MSVLAASLVFAQVLTGQIAVAASAPSAVAACDAVEVRVTVSGPGHVAPQVIAPPLTPFQLVRRTSRPIVNIDPAGGDPTITVEHTFVLTSDRAGRYTLGPFRAELGGQVARSRPLTIDVRSAPGGATAGVVARARIDPSRDVNFRAHAVPDTVYVGEQVQYEVAVFLKESVRDRLRRNPTFFPPDMPGVLAYDVPSRRGDPPRRQVGGKCFDALVYQRALFPLHPGRLVIPPAQLVYALPAGPGLFSRDETHELRTDSVVIVAIAPPADGRPVNDVGAVGSLAVRARVDTAHGRVGDPLTLTLRVAGEGNVKLLPRPRLEIPWATLVPDGERVQVDSVGQRIRGAKEFDWLVTPRHAGRLEIPALEYPHFDPSTRDYVVSRTEPLRLEIEAAPLVRIDTAATPRRYAIRADYRGPLGRPLHQHPGLWVLAAAAPLPALATVIRRRRPAHPPVPSAAESLARLVAAQDVDARAVRRAFVAALAERLGIPAAAFTRAGALERALRRSGVTRALAREAESLLRELDRAAYGATADALDTRAAARSAGRTFAAIDAEALARWELGPLLSLVLVAGSAALLAGTAIAAPSSEETEFRAAARAYEDGRYVEASRGFARLAERVPRAPDAWANYGTAAWVAGDTSGAVAGWQRALRLEPRARDVRSRLDALQVEPVGAPGHVPAIGVTPLALATLGAWLVAWVLAAAPAVRLRRRMGAIAAAFIAALAFGAAAVVTDERLAADDLVVLRRGGGLAASPAIGARRDVRAETGEVGETGAREAGWTYVRFTGGRAGWVPATELTPLARAPMRGD